MLPVRWSQREKGTGRGLDQLKALVRNTTSLFRTYTLSWHFWDEVFVSCPWRYHASTSEYMNCECPSQFGSSACFRIRNPNYPL